MPVNVTPEGLGVEMVEEMDEEDLNVLGNAASGGRGSPARGSNKARAVEEDDEDEEIDVRRRR
jgi:hypothetical protein